MQNSKARPLPRPVVIAMPGNEQLADELATLLWLERGAATVRRFPDGESYVRIASPVGARAALTVCTLDRPDDAVRWLTQVRLRGLADQEVLYRLAQCHQRLGQTDAARHAALACLALQPQHAGSQALLQTLNLAGASPTPRR